MIGDSLAGRGCWQHGFFWRADQLTPGLPPRQAAAARNGYGYSHDGYGYSYGPRAATDSGEGCPRG